ncbi:MAG: NifB/NifX family molybdenum-iron cluster-binding protein [Chloroflexi bacterium]|nr:NifB/NifX family molybdenum-iron cluster-binding protein [Chloroflexota bacterium]
MKKMTKKIIIPTENQEGLEAKVAQHFGRAPYFTVVELDNKGETVKIKAEANTGEHMGGTGHPHENLLALKPDVIAAYGMGPGGLNSFQNAGTTILKAEGETVKEVIDNFKDGTLKELTGGCTPCNRYETKKCVGCPATIHYRGTL